MSQDATIEVTVRLTPREVEMIRLVVGEELSYKEIAARLSISVSTIKMHVEHIYGKVCPNPEFGHVGPGRCVVRLAKFAIRNGIVKL